jgi:hypothetical protein
MPGLVPGIHDFLFLSLPGLTRQSMKPCYALSWIM